MKLLIAGLLIFIGVHSIGIFAPRQRGRWRARLGERHWKGLYSLVSLLGLVLICVGFSQVRHASILLVLYTPPYWMRYVAVVLMLPVFPLLFAAVLPGRIRTTMKHPLLAGVKFWALAHLLANGMLADVLLFGSLLAWAVLDRMSFRRRPPQNIRTAPARPWNDAVAVILGLAVYAFIVLWAHQRLFGVAPLGIN
jgi:uncharacterized membrane protein